MSQAIRHDPYPVAEPYHGLYAYGVELPANTRTLHISGQVGVSPDGELAQGFEAQCRQVFENIKAVLSTASMQLSNIVKLNIYMLDRADMETLLKVRREYLEGVRPAITVVFVQGLVAEDWLVEIEAVASAA